VIAQALGGNAGARLAERLIRSCDQAMSNAEVNVKIKACVPHARCHRAQGRR
jgi:hypothetical protein